MGFKNDFIWGSATASYQIEGAAYEGGKGLSIWDIFCKQEGRIYGNHNGDIACDHYHNYKEDVQLMKQLGIQAYRFSICWSRVIPNGVGEVNEEGIRFYSDLVDELLVNGITPYITLFHWDYPYALHKKGAWMNSESSDWFVAYTEVIANRLGDRVKHYFTLNEPQCFIGLAFSDREMAPCYMSSRSDVLQMVHNTLLAHGKAVKVLREKIVDCKVGYAPTGATFYPVSDSVEDIEAARMATFSVNEGKDWRMGISWWSDPIFLGKYPEDGLKEFGEDMCTFSEEEMKIISQPLDFYGHNIYNSTPIKADGKGGYEIVEFKEGMPRNAVNWPITPKGMYWAAKLLYERYQAPIMITENGMSCHDVVSLDGDVHDPNRIDFMHRYLCELKRAATEGVDVVGYFHWSLMDNFEWAKGYSERFGLIHVDYQTQKRTPKDSFYWYAKTIKENGEDL